MLLTVLFLALAAGPTPTVADKGPKPLPTLAKDPKVDGDLKDLTPATDVKMPEAAAGSSARLNVKAGFRKDTLYLGITVADDVLTDEDLLEVTLYFPDSGTTSRGAVYRFGPEGARAPSLEAGPPPFAAKLVQTATKRDGSGWVLEVAFPPRALPRFQAFKPLTVSICADYADVDSPKGEASKLSTCPTGEMAGGPARLPDDFRKNVKLSLLPSVEGVEARATGWVGFSKLHYPTWAQGDEALTPASLAELVVGDAALDPKSVALPLPRELSLADNRPLFTVLTGENPFVRDSCDSKKELRLALYLVKDNVASRALEWPAATCGLGRAMRFELSDEGTLVIGYTNGAVQHFVWSDEHFERSELGLAH